MVRQTKNSGEQGVDQGGKGQWVVWPDDHEKHKAGRFRKEGEWSANGTPKVRKTLVEKQALNESLQESQGSVRAVRTRITWRA